MYLISSSAPLSFAPGSPVMGGLTPVFTVDAASTGLIATGVETASSTGVISTSPTPYTATGVLTADSTPSVIKTIGEAATGATAKETLPSGSVAAIAATLPAATPAPPVNYGKIAGFAALALVVFFIAYKVYAATQTGGK